jgi:excisionase family DNA binding protein
MARRAARTKDDQLSTTEVGWLLDVSPSAVRRMIRDGEIDGHLIPGGFRIPRAEALRLARERIEREAGRNVTDSELERLVDQVLETNRQVT